MNPFVVTTTSPARNVGSLRKGPSGPSPPLAASIAAMTSCGDGASVRAYPPRPEGDADGRRAAVRTRKDRSNPVGTNSRRDGIHDRDSEDKPRQAHKQTGLPRAADRRREMRTDLQFGPLRHRKTPPLGSRSDRVTSKTVLCDDRTFCKPCLSTANSRLANKLRDRVGPACPAGTQG